MKASLLPSRVYILKGDPIPLARARHFCNRIYDSQKSLKTIARVDLASQHDDLPLLVGPLHLDVKFFMKLPSSISKKRAELLIGKAHTTRPDLDNMLKWIFDLGSGVLYQDDTIIFSTSAEKIYDLNPRTEFVFKRV
jgi:Holliday junction resolvase RusA-like endonuclease